MFDGNTADPNTVGAHIEKLRRRFALSRVVLVGDRGMLTEARIREEVAPAGLDWISALRAPAIRELMSSGAVQRSMFDETDLAEVRCDAYPGERLIVCRNERLAEERARKREALLQATEARLAPIGAATQREKRRLSGKEKIALRVGKVIGKYKMAKHFELDITETAFAYHRKADAIAAEAALDGLYIVRTSVPATELDAEHTVRAYKGLSVVERAFRSLKTVDLKVRPIYHYAGARVRAHVFLCMLAYYVEWHMRQRLKPLLFDDEEPDVAEAARPSVVAPAEVSPSAQDKARRKRTASGEPVHSFRTLLDDLATACVRLGPSAGTLRLSERTARTVRSAHGGNAQDAGARHRLGRVRPRAPRRARARDPRARPANGVACGVGSGPHRHPHHRRRDGAHDCLGDWSGPVALSHPRALLLVADAGPGDAYQRR